MSDYSRALPEAMGYSVEIDTTAGYGVTRMLASRNGLTTVWRPRDDSEQCFEVMCWLLSPALSMSSRDKGFFTITSWNVQRSKWEKEFELEPVICWSKGHDGTPAGLRAAIVEAAERVAKQ